MNWYQKIKISDQMPITIDEGNPYKGWGYGAENLDDYLSEEDARRISKSHPSLKYLGEGSQGVAYQFGEESSPGDPITKLTISAEEFENVRKILKLQKKHGGTVPGIVHVFYAEKTTDNLIKNVYQVYAEHVRRLDKTEGQVIASLCLFELGQDPKKTGQLIGEIFEEAAITKKYGVEYVKYISIVGKFLRLVANLNSIAPDGRDNFWDLKDFNMGVEDNGNYVLFDIGRIKI